MNSIIIRPKQVKIGKDNINYYAWLGIKSIKWSDATPWEHIEIPTGPMIHQHIHSLHIKGEIKCHDLSKLYTAIFNTAINAAGNFAVDPTTFIRTNVEYLVVTIVNENKTDIDIAITGFKVETIGVESIELGTEALWVITFTADKVTYPSGA